MVLADHVTRTMAFDWRTISKFKWFVFQVGRGLFSFITYRVYTCIGLDKMAKNEFTVYRRYRDFLKLHEKLEDRSVEIQGALIHLEFDIIQQR